MLLEEEHEHELSLLISLFGERIVSQRLSKINYIYQETERLWREQVAFIPNTVVRYLLIAEAPPWTPEGDVVYVYNPKSKPRSLLPALCEAFFQEKIYKKEGTITALKKLSRKGFLLIDSIPFAMNYSAKRQRAAYRKLVAVCATSYLLKKINNSEIRWHSKLTVAFTVKKNAEVLINHFKNGIPIDGLSHKLLINDGNIAVNRANYPCYRKLRQIYDL